MWRPKGQRGPKTPQRGAAAMDGQDAEQQQQQQHQTTPRRGSRGDCREEAEAALEDSDVEVEQEGATPRSASKRRLSLPVLLKRLASPPPLGRRRRRTGSQGGEEEGGEEQRQPPQQEGPETPAAVGGEQAAGEGEAEETAAVTSREAAAAIDAAAEEEQGEGQQEEGEALAAAPESSESEEEQPDPEAVKALRSVPASPFPPPITPSKVGKGPRAATDELRQSLAAHHGASVLATPVQEEAASTAGEHDSGGSRHSGAASSTVAVVGEGSLASPMGGLSLEEEEQASQMTGTSPLSPASSRRPTTTAGVAGSPLSFRTGATGTPSRRGVGAGGGGGSARLLSRESMLQAELYRARKQLEEERAKAQAACEQEMRWREEAEGRQAASLHAQALQGAVARWSRDYWAGVRTGDGAGAEAALARAVAAELPTLLDVEQARLFVVGDGRLWTVGPTPADATVVGAPLGTGLVGQAVAAGATIVSEDGCMACVPVVCIGSSRGAYAVLQCTRDEAAHGFRPFQQQEEAEGEASGPTALLRSLAQQLAPMLAAGRQTAALRAARRRALARVATAVARRRQARALARWAAACGVETSGTSMALTVVGAGGGGVELLAEALRAMETLAPSGQQYLLVEALEKAARALLEAHGVGVAGVWAGMQDLLPEEALALGPVGGAGGGVMDVPFAFLHCTGAPGEEEDGSDAAYTWERVQGMLRVQLADGASVPLKNRLRRLLQLLAGCAAGWLSSLAVPRLVRRARELGAEGDISRREAVQLRGEAINLHDQVYRQQAELNALGQRLESAAARVHAGSAVLEAAERLLGSAWGWEGLRDALPAAASLLLRFDRLEYRFRASAALLALGPEDEEQEGLQEAAGGMMHVLEVVDVASSMEARHSAVLGQVMASGTAALSQLRSSDLSAIASSPVASLCLPLALGDATVGALLLERRGEPSGEGFSEEEVAGATRMAALLAGVMRCLACKQVREDRLRRAGGSAGQRSGKLLAAAEQLWAKAGAVEEVYAEFEQGVAALLPVGEASPQAQCTLFLADAQHGLLRAANGESVPLGVGVLGAAAASGRALWEGRHSLHVPVMVPEDRTVLAVARVCFSRGRAGLEQLQQHMPVEDGVAEEEQEELLRAVEALVRILLPVLQHSQALQTAFGGMRDASDALESLSGRLAAAREEAAVEASGRVRAEEVVAAMQRLHVDCSRGPDSLVALFRAAETAACLAAGADAAALLLVVDEEEGPASEDGAGSPVVGRPPELWTLWPVETGQGQERGRLRIPQEAAPAEVHAVMQGATLAISSGHVEQQQHTGPVAAFTPFQSWLFGHVEVDRGVGGGDEVGEEGGGVLLPESTVLMVPVLQLSGGVAGVLEVVKRGRLDGQEEGALVVLARALSTVLAWFQAQLQLARARGEEAALRQALVEQAKAAEGLDVGARQAGVLANLAFDLLAAPDRPTALALAEAHLQEAMGAQAVRLQPQQGPQQQQQPKRFAESTGGADGLEVSLGVRKGRLECEITGVEGRVLGMVVVDGPGMALESGAELNEEEIQLLVARTWVMLERALGALAWREATVAAAGGWERLSRRLLDMVGLAARGLGPRATLPAPPSEEALDPTGPVIQAQAAVLWPHVRLAEEAAMDLLGADAARLYLVGRERALALLLASLGMGGMPTSPATADPAAIPLELWALVGGAQPDGAEGEALEAAWCLEKQQPLQQARGHAAAAVWDHLRRWLPLLGYAEDGQGRLLLRPAMLEAGEMSEADPELAMDIRWPHGAADARRGRHGALPPVMSVPIFLPSLSPQQPLPLAEALVGVLVVERGGGLGEDPSSALSFTRGDALLAAQWSLRLAELLGGLVREGFLRSHALAQQRAAKLALLGRRLATARTRQAFQRWWRNMRLDTRDNVTAAQTQAAAAGAARARVLQLLAACVECVGGLGPVAVEEEETEVLLSELEQLVSQRLPAALPAQRCTLTLLRPGEEMKLKSSVEGKGRKGAGILLSKPVLTTGGDLVGLLEAALDDAGEVAVIEEADRALALAAKLVGGLATLLRELGSAKEKHGEAALLAKVLESQAQLYREAAEAAVRCEALATDAGAFLLHKSDLAAAFIPAAHDLEALGRVVSEQLPRLLAPAPAATGTGAVAASATLLLPSRLCSPSGRQDDKGVQFTPAYQDAAASPRGALAVLVEAKTPELLERCRVTRRRVVRVLKDKGGGARLLCDPVLDAEDGTMWAVLRVVLPPAADAEVQEAEAEEARDKVLGWVVGVLATAVEGARRVEALREKAALDNWLAVRYRRLAEFGRVLRLQDAGEAALLAWVSEQAGAILGAERAAIFLRGSSDSEAEGLSLVKADGEGTRAVGPEAALAKSAVAQLLRAASSGVPAGQRRVWGLPRTALLAYDAGVDVALVRGDVLGMTELEGAAGPSGVLQAAWDPAKLPAGALDAARPLAKEMARQVAATIGALRGPQRMKQQPLGPVVPSDGGMQQLGLRLAKDLLPRLLASPLREPRIQAVMRSVTQQGERLLLASLSARLASCSMAVDFFALDQEGLWTLARPHEQPGAGGEERILTVPAAARGVLAQAAREQRPLVRRYEGAVGQEEGDLAGGVVSGTAAVTTIAAFPVISPTAPPPAAAAAGGSESPSTGGDRLRGVLHCVVRGPTTAASEATALLSSDEEALLGALAHVVAAAVTVLDSAAASKSFGELYERAAAALALAQGNVLKSRERTERLQGLCACALMAALPLWWEPAAPLTGQVARVAQAALQGCRALFGCRRAALLLVQGGDPQQQQQQRALDVFEAAAPTEHGEEEGSIHRSQTPWPRGGLLGRCLRKGQALNVPGRGGKEKGQGSQQPYDPAVDGPDPSAPTLLLPLRGPGEAVLGVLRLWRAAAAPFTREEEIMAEVYASHLAVAFSYAQAIDGHGTPVPLPAAAATAPAMPGMVSAPLSVASSTAAGARTPSLLSMLGPSEAMGVASVRFSTPRTGPLSSMRVLPGGVGSVAAAAAAPLSSLGGRDVDASFFALAAGGAEPPPQSQLEEIKRQLRDIHRSTRRALSGMQQDGSGSGTPAAPPAGALNTSSTSLLAVAGAGDVSMLDTQSVASSVRGGGSAVEAMNRSLDALAARHLKSTAAGPHSNADDSFLSAPPVVGGAAAATGAAAGTGDLGERIREMKAENQRLSQTLNVFLARRNE